MAFQESVSFTVDGEQVKAGVANRAPRTNDANIRFLRNRVDDITAGETIVAVDRTVASNVQVGQPVYFNSTTLQFEQALSQTETDITTNQLVVASTAIVWGIVLNKTNPTLADILLSGIADIDMSLAIDGTITTGIYYLSGAEPGKLVKTRPPVGVNVLIVGQDGVLTGTHEVFVNARFHDFLEQHRHVKFSLVPLPAGTVVPPAAGAVHTITADDILTEGWLPAGNAIFSGNAPTGAKFGYNLSQSKLGPVWPPIPVENAVLQVARKSIYEDIKGLHRDFVHDFPSIAAHSQADQVFAFPGVLVGDNIILTAGTSLPAEMSIDAWVSSTDVITIRMTNSSTGAVDPAITTFHAVAFPHSSDTAVKFPGFVTAKPDHVILDANGIWWMTDCYNEVPWPTDLNTVAPTSISVTEDCPADIDGADILLDLWYTNSLFFTNDQAVLSIQGAAGSGITVVCRGTDDVKSVGHLEILLFLGLLIDSDDDEAGHLVIKDIRDNTFFRGPIAESIRSASPEVVLTSDVPGLGPNGERYGNIVLTANLDINGAEFAVDTVRLDGVTEEFFQDVLALGFSSARASEFRGRVKIPTRVALPAGTKMKLRFWVLGRTAGSIPASVFTLTRRTLTRPTTILTDEVTLPLVDVALTMTTTATITTANNYIEMESAQFNVVAGDEILFTIKRSAPDSYAGELQLLRSEGVLVAPAV